MGWQPEVVVVHGEVDEGSAQEVLEALDEDEGGELGAELEDFLGAAGQVPGVEEAYRRGSGVGVVCESARDARAAFPRVFDLMPPGSRMVDVYSYEVYAGAGDFADAFPEDDDEDEDDEG